MNFESVGHQIAVIKNKKDKIDKTISISDNQKKVTNSYAEINLHEGQRIQQIPDKELERSVLYVTGQAGSGKSHYVKNFTKEYHRMYPKNEVYLITSLASDTTIDELKYIQKIKLTPEFISTEFTIEDFENCLVIFDDTDNISNKQIKNKITSLLNMILEIGRHAKTSVCYTSHLACKSLETRYILNECHYVTIFPKTMGNRNLKYLLDNYFGLNNKDIEMIKRLPSRWVTIIKTYPTVLLTQHSATILHR